MTRWASTSPAAPARGKLAAAGHLGGSPAPAPARARPTHQVDMQPERGRTTLRSWCSLASVASSPPSPASPPTVWGGDQAVRRHHLGGEVGWSGQPRCWVQWVVGRGASPPLLRPALLCSAGNFHIINSAAQLQAAAPAHSRPELSSQIQPDIARCLTSTDSEAASSQQ